MRRVAAGLSGLALTLAIGGCGAERDKGAEPPSGDRGGVSAVGGQAMVDAQLALARCMREQGIDMPDPQPGGRGSEFDPGAQGISQQRLREAEANCKEEMDALAESAPPVSEDQRAAARDATLRFARCMRAEGQDVPDPETGAPGGGTAVEVPSDAKTNPAFVAAQKKCESILREGEAGSP